MFFHFVTKHLSDRQTVRENYDPKDCASIAASLGKNNYNNSTVYHILLESHTNEHS